MRLLIPLDGSQLAEQALAPAKELLAHGASDSTLLLYRVVRYPALAIDVPSHGSPIARTGLLDEALDASEDYLRRVALTPELAGLDVDYATDDGDPADLIIAQAPKFGADLIVMTSHGRTGVARFVLGSVAEAVSRKSATPTLIFRPTRLTLERQPTMGPFTVAIPLDGSSWAEAIIEPAVKLVTAFEGELRLIMVLPDQEPEPVMRRRIDQAHAYLSRLHQRLELRSIPTHRDVLWGDPVEQIVEDLRHHHIDVLAMATHAGAGLRSWLRRDRAFLVMEQMSLPMLLLHAEDAAGGLAAQVGD